MATSLGYKTISADSHITEPPNCYIDYIDPKYRDVAPHINTDVAGVVFVIPGIDAKIPLGTIAAAGIPPQDIRADVASFDALHRGGWDPTARLADQDRDGVGGEMIYPSVGMALVNHPDSDYKEACFMAYNRWLQEFQGGAPDRLFGLGQTAVKSVASAIEDLHRIKEMGFRGVMMPCYPDTEEDYDHPSFDPLWRAAVELELPLSFHILTSGKKGSSFNFNPVPGPKANFAQSLIRANQDVIGVFIWGRIFERHPELRLVCVEADAGWVPHFTQRLDHFYNRHRFHTKVGDLKRLPSEYFLDNVYMTFQDDWVAFQMTHLMNPRRLMWANDFPHSDATWPNSQAMLEKHTKHLSDQEKRWILRDNVVELYKLPVH